MPRNDFDVKQVSIAESFGVAAARSSSGQFSVHHMGGYNPAVGTALEDIWTPGGIHSFPTTATACHFWSGSTNDTATGSGLRSLRVTGLLSGLTEASETVAIDSANTVSSTNLYRRINGVTAYASGSYDGSTIGGHGTISVYKDATLQGYMFPDANKINHGVMLSGRYCVPYGKIGYITHMSRSFNANKIGSLYLMKREGADTVTAPFTPKQVLFACEGSSGYLTERLDQPLVIPAGTDIWCSGIASSTAIISTHVGIYLVDA